MSSQNDNQRMTPKPSVGTDAGRLSDPEQLTRMIGNLAWRARDQQRDGLANYCEELIDWMDRQLAEGMSVRLIGTSVRHWCSQISFWLENQDNFDIADPAIQQWPSELRDLLERSVLQDTSATESDDLSEVDDIADDQWADGLDLGIDLNPDLDLSTGTRPNNDSEEGPISAAEESLDQQVKPELEIADSAILGVDAGQDEIQAEDLEEARENDWKNGSGNGAEESQVEESRVEEVQAQASQVEESAQSTSVEQEPPVLKVDEVENPGPVEAQDSGFEQIAPNLAMGEEPALASDEKIATDYPDDSGIDEEPAAGNRAAEVLDLLAVEVRDIVDGVDYNTGLAADHSNPLELRAEALQRSLDIIERLIEVCDSLNLQGLRDACVFVSQAMGQAKSEPDQWQQSHRILIQEWFAAVEEYLESQARDDQALALVMQMQDLQWFDPLDDSHARTLLADLLTVSLELSVVQEEEGRARVATEEEVALHVAADARGSLIEAFAIEAPKQCAELRWNLERAVADTELLESLQAAQRLTHTLKGSGNLLGVVGLANLSHHLEDLLSFCAQHRLTLSDDFSLLLEEAVDCIESMVDTILGRDQAPADALSILQRVLDWANLADQGLEAFKQGPISRETDAGDSRFSAAENSEYELEPDTDDSANTEGNSQTDANIDSLIRRIAQPEPESVVASDTPTASHPPASTADSGPDNARANQPVIVGQAPANKTGEAARYQADQTFAVRADMLDDLFRLVGEMSISLNQMRVKVEELGGRSTAFHQQDQLLQSRRLELENSVSVRRLAGAQNRAAGNFRSGESNAFDSLEMDEYDELYSTAHGYIEAVVDSHEVRGEILKDLKSLNTLVDRQREMNLEVQQLAMKARMVEVSTYETRLSRVVRQTCRQVGKKAQLHLVGAELLIDRHVLEQLADPVMHMLRNAVDHGIESPEQRVQAGKLEAGQINIEFSRVGNNILLICTDDGRGLNVAHIREKAMAEGLLKNVQATDNEVLRMLLTPGFTTRSEVTQISGRGVGLDLIDNVVRELGGFMDIANRVESGCEIRIQVPLTLITNHSIIVRAGEVRYAIPTTQITQILPPDTGGFSILADRLMFQLSGEMHKAWVLSELLGGGTTATGRPESMAVILVRVENDVQALLIDQAIGNEEIVVKDLGVYVPKLPGVGGVAVLGDGQVIPVLDLQNLLSDARQPVASRPPHTYRSHEAHGPEGIAGTGKPALRKVMIVDDSLSVRRTLSELISDAGYQVVIARDGLEAVELLVKERPVAVLADLEMPRMNGLELTSHIRGTPKLAEIPIIMITSRSQRKHRDEASRVGVTAYINKPYTEDELLGLLHEHTQGAMV